MPPKEGVVPTQRGSYAKLNEIVHTILKEGVGAQSFAKREGVARGREGVVPTQNPKRELCQLKEGVVPQ